MYPEDCVQSIIGSNDWWTKNNGNTLCRGALVFAFAPHIDQVPYTFEPLGRKEADQHGNARVRVAPLRVNQPLKKTDVLPVAAMPLHQGEVWAAYRAKKRPCLVIGYGSKPVGRELTKSMAKHSTAPTILIAPYYGATKNGKRGGYRPEFVERVRHCVNTLNSCGTACQYAGQRKSPFSDWTTCSQLAHIIIRMSYPIIISVMVRLNLLMSSCNG